MFAVVGIGAGLVSALLAAVAITGAPLAALLNFVAPLPILIVALGWNHRAGLIAAAAAGLAGAVALNPKFGIAFVLMIGLPAWWIGYLALLARPDGKGEAEWYPLGRVLLWIAVTAALAALGSALVMTLDYEVYLRALTEFAAVHLDTLVRNRILALSPETTANEVARIVAPMLPIVIGASFATMNVANLWLAAKTVQLSGRLHRPWPFIPATSIPRSALFVFGGAILALFAGGFIGVAGTALIGALLAVFMFSGLALLHDLSRGKPWRAPALITLYLALFLMQTLLTPLLTLAGIIDTMAGRRTAPPPASPPQPKT